MKATIAAALALATFCTVARAAQADAMFRSDAAHTGAYASAAPQLNHVRWRFRAKGAFISSPTVNGGSVYIGSDDGHIYALKAADGALVWEQVTQGPVRSTPAVANGLVFASSLDGNVYALEAANGEPVWHFTTGGERRFTAPGIHGIIPKNELMADPFDIFISSPVVADGVVYVGSGDHNVYALDAATGALKWKFATGDVVHASPAVANGTVYVGSWDRFFYALDAKTGALRWKFETGDDRNIYNQVGIASSAAVANGVVYFGCRDSKLYALNATTGTLRWKHDEHGSWVVGAPAVKGGNVFFTTSDEKKFFALDAATGTEKFNQGYSAFSFSSPSLAGNEAYFGTFDGLLFEINTRTGAVDGQFATDGARSKRAAHLDAKGAIDLNTFYADDTYEGIVVGLSRIFELGSIPGSPAIANGTLFIGDTTGVLYAMGD